MKYPIHCYYFQVYSELPVQEIWEMWRNPSLPLLPGTLRGSSFGDLESVEYPFITITARYTQMFNFRKSEKRGIPLHCHYPQAHSEFPVLEILEIWSTLFIAISSRYTQSFQFWRSGICGVLRSLPLLPGTLWGSSFGDWKVWSATSLPLLLGTRRCSTSWDLRSVKHFFIVVTTTYTQSFQV